MCASGCGKSRPFEVSPCLILPAARLAHACALAARPLPGPSRAALSYWWRASTLSCHPQVRHGDKLGTLHTDDEVVRHAALARAHAVSLGLSAVHFMSDSLEARTTFTRALEGISK